MAFHITTVCTGNICRSPMAEYLIRQAAEDSGLTADGEGGVVVDSYGISDEEQGNPADPRARALLEEHGMDPSGHRARQLTAEALDAADLVLALDLNHLRAMRRMATAEQRERIRLMREFDPQVAGQPEDELGIYDPWYGDESDFQTTFEMIRAAVPGVIDHARRAA